MSEENVPSIPYDIYESPQELVIFLPFWWVKKESINLSIRDYKLVISWVRLKPEIKESLIPLKESC